VQVSFLLIFLRLHLSLKPVCFLVANRTETASVGFSAVSGAIKMFGRSDY